MSLIILTKIGRGKVSDKLKINNPELNGKKKYDEEDLAEMAYKEACKHLMSRSSWLEPDEEKGNGYWKVYVGMGNHVGDVRIVV